MKSFKRFLIFFVLLFAIMITASPPETKAEVSKIVISYDVICQPNLQNNFILNSQDMFTVDSNYNRIGYSIGLMYN